MSHYAVVEFQPAEIDPSSAPATTPPSTLPSVTMTPATAEWARDIVDLSKPAPVQASELFHPVIAKVNRVLLGMRAFGTGRGADTGGLGYRFWPTYTGVSMALVVAPLFYCLGLSWMVAGISSVFSFLPMMVGSNFDETKAMGSKILGHRIVRLLRGNEPKGTQELAKVRGFFILLPDWIIGCFIFTFLFILPHVLIVTPTAAAQPDDAGLQSMWLVATVSLSGLCIAQLTVFYFFSAWTPLMELYTREICDQSDLAVTKIASILNDASLSPREARERLGILHDRVLEPLREDFRGTLEPYMRSIFIVFLLMLVPVITMSVATIDMERSVIVVGDAGSMAIRFTFAGMLGLLAPLAMRLLLRSLAIPWRSWRRLEKLLRHAGTYARAAEKFGGGDVFEKWLERNSMAIRLFGVPVDDNLGGKVAGLAASVVGGVVLYLSRMLFV